MKTSNIIYDEIASNYGYDIQRSTAEHLKYNLLFQYIEKKDSVLDIGCANGLYSLPISAHCKHVTSLDINQKLLDLLEVKVKEKKVKNLKIVNKDAQDISDFQKQSFNVIFSYSTLLLVPEVNKVFSALNTLLKKEGICILDITGCYNLSQRFWRKWYASKGHHTLNAFSYKEISNILENSGLRIVKSYGLGFCDQWKYLPIINKIASKLAFIDKIFHHRVGSDLDYLISNLPGIKKFSNRWLIVAQKI